ncbi:TPA: tail fiber domain-containing protein [Escherichia coli]|nr:tail fiber domain-containing protein [Escherichia coli]
MANLKSVNTWGAQQNMPQLETIDLNNWLGVSHPSLSDSTVGAHTGFNLTSANVFRLLRRKVRTDINGQYELIFPDTSGTIAMSSSDRELKENITDSAPGAYDRLSKLRPVEYKLKNQYANDFEASKSRRGFIAQEAAEADVCYASEPVEGQFWGIEDRAIIADLVAVVVEMKSLIRDLTDSMNQSS